VGLAINLETEAKSRDSITGLDMRCILHFLQRILVSSLKGFQEHAKHLVNYQGTQDRILLGRLEGGSVTFGSQVS